MHFLMIVRELGFAHPAWGCGGIATLFAPSWTPPLALLGFFVWTLRFN